MQKDEDTPMVTTSTRSGKTDERASSSALAVERAADMLLALSQDTEMSLTELAEEADCGLNAAHRILVALTRKGLVAQRAKSNLYHLGGQASRLANAWSDHRRIAELALPTLVSLRDTTSESVALSLRVGTERIVVQHVESEQEITWRVRIGRLGPLYAGAPGLVLLAEFSTLELKRYFDSLSVLDDSAIEKIRAELDLVRTEGWALSIESPSVGAVALSAPVRDVSGTCIAALSVVIPRQRWEEHRQEEILSPLRSAAQDLTPLL